MSGSAASYRVRPQRTVQGELRVPGDKSISHRAMMLGGIADGVTEVDGFLASADCLSTLNAMRAMGVAIDRLAEGRVRIQGAGLHGLKAPRQALDMGNAGTAMRLSMGLLAGVLGDKWNLGFLAETERQVEAHLASHLDKLPPQDAKSRAIVEQMRVDEVAHGAAAQALGLIPSIERTTIATATKSRQFAIPPLE